jgi:N-carbamoylputrescine amidase
VRLTVCQLRDTPDGIAEDWDALVEHARAAGSDLVVLPEVAFGPWPFAAPDAEPATWAAFCGAHDYWMRRLGETGAAVVAGSRPILHNGSRRNEGFVWSPDDGYRGVHHKRYLPDEPGWWEASWYEPGDGDFETARTPAAAIGFLICTELWFPEYARGYGRAGADLVAAPRATDAEGTGAWIAGGRTAAVIGGTFCASSNRAGSSAGIVWGGTGWVIEPDGDILATTSDGEPFITVEIDLAAAAAAKHTYPRYVPD